MIAAFATGTAISFKPEKMANFEEFMHINMRLEARTVKDTVGLIKRFLQVSNNTVSYETVEAYLKTYLNKAPKTYNSQITALRRFICEFLKNKDMIESFKMAVVDSLKKYSSPNKTAGTVRVRSIRRLP